MEGMERALSVLRRTRRAQRTRMNSITLGPGKSWAEQGGRHLDGHIPRETWDRGRVITPTAKAGND